MKRIFVIAIIWLGFLVVNASAQDQAITINDQLQDLPPGWGEKLRDKLNNETAKNLIQDTLGKSTVVNLTDPSFYCIIHILQWNTDKPSERLVKKQSWFLYHAGKWSQTQFEALRIYGSKNVALLFVHLDERADSEYRFPTYRVEVTKKLPAPVQNLIALINLGSTIAKADVSPPARKDGWGGAVMSIEHVPSDITVKALVIPGVTGAAFKTARNAKDEIDSAKDARKSAQTKRDIAEKVLNEKTKDRTARDSDREALATASDDLNQAKERLKQAAAKFEEATEVARQATGAALQEIGKQTYDNEGRYYWDVSVGLPVTKINELEFNAQSGSVQAKEIDKQKLFAFFNFYLKPIDTKGTHVESWPHPIVGLALSKKPLDRIFVGGGWGLNKIDFFAGVAFNKTQSPSTLPQGAAATQSQLESDLKTKYQAKFVVGLNVPVRQILDKLKAK